MRKRSPEFKRAMAAYDADDGAQAFQLMETCAEAGEPMACAMAALWCQKGEGTAVDPERCAHWIERLQALADDGNLEAQWELSCMQRWGDIVSLDIRIANHWLERAAKGGYGEAQHLLAWYYQTGQYGYPVDLSKANAWYEKAFALGNPETLYLFALREFLDGKPTEAAIRLLKQAADKGFSQARYVLEDFGY
ncbi:hypothetical protein BKK80_22700 [Cupriavidus malaysiensis]|uniref:Sel1 repeat family protein n=2 Tax=Cupriavidus malaysiensis TaxID=367825 RepID=A0ABN4TN34_9BURK|nr:hypothetical protein BKK80_22700 [Cupriavidus malaysiensis]